MLEIVTKLSVDALVALGRRMEREGFEGSLEDYAVSLMLAAARRAEEQPAQAY